MTNHEIEATVAYIGSLWPKHELTEAVLGLLAERMARLPIDSEQAKAALGEFRLSSKWRTPDTGEILRRLQACRGAAPADLSVSAASVWELRGFQMKLPGEYPDEAIVAVWCWRIAKRAATVYGHEWAVSSMITAHVCALVDELGWAPANARAVSAQRWGFDKLADEFLNGRYAA